MYDVFISYYRKTGSVQARLIKSELEKRGFRVFLDYSDDRDETIDHSIESAIKDAAIFLIVMTDGILNDCHKKDNWLRREIDWAYKYGRRIVPIAPSDSNWDYPENLPWPEFKSIRVSKLDMEEWFDLTIARIIKKRFGRMNPIDRSHEGPHQPSGTPAKRVALLRKAAKQGDKIAQYNLGMSYSLGDGVRQNAVKAAEWWLKAAGQGFVKAQYNIGYCYDTGNGVEQNAAEAVKWWVKAAAQGEVRAQNNLGHCYAEGSGVERDMERAVFWFSKAAKQGSGSAQVSLGFCYAHGNGVSQNIRKAVRWWREAANKGSARAQFNLGACYAKGDGVTQDATKAAFWFYKAAAQGDADAQYNLGACYAEGMGLMQDAVAAEAWWRKASARGDAAASSALARLSLPQSTLKANREEDYEQGIDYRN